MAGNELVFARKDVANAPLALFFVRRGHRRSPFFLSLPFRKGEWSAGEAPWGPGPPGGGLTDLRRERTDGAFPLRD